MTDLSRLYSNDAELAVIGALLSDPSCVDRLGQLKPDHCYTASNRLILAQIFSMLAHNKPVDAVTVAEELAEAGFEEETGSLAHLGEIVANSLGSSNVKRYAEIVLEKALERQLLAVSDVIRDTVQGAGTTRDKLMASQSAVMSITEAVETKKPKTMREALAFAVTVLEHRSKNVYTGVPTSFCDLDEKLGGGMDRGDLIIVAGRPSMGKTVFAVNIAENVAGSGFPVAVFSMEMATQQIIDRCIARRGLVPLSDVRQGRMGGESGDRIMVAVEALHTLPLMIDDQGGLTLFELATKCRSIKRQMGGLGGVVVDYLQLMTGEGNSRKSTRNDQLSDITRGVKSLAKEMDCPIVLLSQLNRELEKRPNKRPVMSDLRDSGAIEQDADVIMFIYRDEVYNPESPDKGTAEIIIGKARQGETGKIQLGFQGQFCRFLDLAHGWQSQIQTKQSGFRRGMKDD